MNTTYKKQSYQNQNNKHDIQKTILSKSNNKHKIQKEKENNSY